MKPLYAAQIGDVLDAPGAAVIATCTRCQRSAYVPREVLAVLPRHERVVDLERRLRCHCGHRGGTEWVR